MKAGFDPAGFWRETPRSFVTIMRGAAHAAEKRHEEMIALAWHTAAFGGAAQAGKLKKLGHYLTKPKKAQTADEMLMALREFQSRGAGMTIRQVN